MRRIDDALAAMPLVVRYAVIGAVVAGVPGTAVGLAIGVVAYPPTAWFAALEIGAPTALLGFTLGLLIGAAGIGVNAFITRARKTR